MSNPNISDEILKAAAERKLPHLCTGGGCDYVFRGLGTDFEKDPLMILAVDGDAGSPKTLQEPAVVRLFFNADEWTKGPFINFAFDTARQALDFMAGQQASGLDSVKWEGPY